MASLSSCQGCSSPAEALHTSQGEPSFCAHRAGSNQENSAWYMGTWNVRFFFVCEVCARKFRRESDKKRHKCLAERQKPISEQRGAVRCQQCHSWFRSRGGLTVHRCRSGP